MALVSVICLLSIIAPIALLFCVMSYDINRNMNSMMPGIVDYNIHYVGFRIKWDEYFGVVIWKMDRINSPSVSDGRLSGTWSLFPFRHVTIGFHDSTY